jgi:hypothetical protein
MLNLGIDKNARQITISLRDENGDVLQARQVSTQPEKINVFFQRLMRERLRNGESFVAVLEVCGINAWLIGMLHDYRCAEVILIQPDERKRRKTDRRDAAALSELLWVRRIPADPTGTTVMRGTRDCRRRKPLPSVEPADLAARFSARGCPDICPRCKQSSKSWTFVGGDGSSVYLCSECVAGLMDDREATIL